MLMFEKLNASVGLLVFQKMNSYPVSTVMCNLLWNIYDSLKKTLKSYPVSTVKSNITLYWKYLPGNIEKHFNNILSQISETNAFITKITSIPTEPVRVGLTNPTRLIYFTTQTPKKYCTASWDKCEPESKPRSRRRQAPCSPSCWAAASHHLHSPRSLCLCLCCCLSFCCCLILCQLLFHFLFLVRNRFSPPLCSSASADWRLWTLLAVRRPAFTCKQKGSNVI